MERGLGGNVVYLNFVKAFDKFDHGELLRKVSPLGIRRLTRDTELPNRMEGGLERVCRM